jgi:hypothetical protein
VSLIETFSGSRVTTNTLSALIDDLPKMNATEDLGDDITKANLTLLSDAPTAEKQLVLFHWIGRCQPCLFGRLASHEGRGTNASKGLRVSMCWIFDEDIDRGHDHVAEKIQRARRAWKTHAACGESSGFLIMFNSPRLAYAAPSAQLVRLCLELANLYLIEHTPIRPDVIYTEALPLRHSDGVRLYKAGCNIFYTGAHGTRNHDRRIPGGLMFSMNAVGHYAHSLVMRGLMSSLDAAVAFVRDTAYRSVGNGGIGVPVIESQTWHKTVRGADEPGICPARRLPSYVPADFDPMSYAGLYHTDVLVPTSVTADQASVSGRYDDTDIEIWPNLGFDYLTEESFPAEHENYGQFLGMPVDECNMYYNPWQARSVINE